MMDEMVGGLLRGLEDRNLSGVVDLLIVSDHGEWRMILAEAKG